MAGRVSAPQKNYALSLAQGDWVLSIDADERVTPELAQAIRAAIEPGKADGYEILRRSSFCGRDDAAFGLVSATRVLRLFRRDKARFTDDRGARARRLRRQVGAPPRADAALSGGGWRTRSAAWTSYSTLGAREDRGLRPARFRSLSGDRARHRSRSCASMCCKLGFLDGAAGFMLAVANAEGAYYRYMKAWLASATP